MKIRPALSLVMAFAFSSALGCASSSTPAPVGTDAGADSGVPVDSGTVVVNTCTTFEDHTATADTRTLTWDLSIGASPSRCTRIKVGQAVTWAGSFTTHPLQVLGGTTPNPIATVDTSGKVTFTSAGTFGYVCGVHASMNGAILVVQ